MFFNNCFLFLLTPTPTNVILGFDRMGSETVNIDVNIYTYIYMFVNIDETLHSFFKKLLLF